jgi:hypothetical protein
MQQWNTEYLIGLVKEKETIPDSGVAYSPDVLLRYLDQSIKGFIVPAIESVLEEHFVVTMDIQVPGIPVPTPGNIPVDVGNSIPIPGESTGLRLRDVYVVGSDGSFFNLPRLTPTQAAAQSFGNPWGPSLPTYSNQLMGGFFLQGNEIQIFPYGLASNKTIRLTYFRSPADLCLVENAGKVVNVSGDVLTLDKTLTWYPNTTSVDVISGDLPHDYVKDASVPTVVYSSYAPLRNKILAGVSGNIITLPTGTGTNVKVGDWVCPNGFSVFAQNIPKELLPALVQKAASMCIHSAGDNSGYQVAEKEFTDMMTLALPLMAPRVIGKPQKIISTNSGFRASRSSNYGRW